MEFYNFDKIADAEVFHDLIKQGKTGMIKFHHPNCGHCQAMKPNWDQMCNELKQEYGESEGNIMVIEIHADLVPHLMKQISQHVNGYPTIIEMREGGVKGDDYQGDRSAEDMKKWFIDHFSKQGLQTHKKDHGHHHGHHHGHQMKRSSCGSRKLGGRIRKPHHHKKRKSCRKSRLHKSIPQLIRSLQKGGKRKSRKSKHKKRRTSKRRTHRRRRKY